MKTPTPEQIKEARRNAGHSQVQAARTVWCTTRGWQYYEAGQREMPRATWELYLLKTGVTVDDAI